MIKNNKIFTRSLLLFLIVMSVLSVEKTYACDVTKSYLADLEGNPQLLAAVKANADLPLAWNILRDFPILRKKPENLESLSQWFGRGVDPDKVSEGIAKSRSKQKLIDDIGNAQSPTHVSVLIKDYDNIPGVSKGRYVPNGSTLADKAELPPGWNGSHDITRDSVISSFTGKINPIELRSGDKIYRVTESGRQGGAYWTKEKPTGIGDVVGGTAVQPQWNNFENIYEYTVPDGVIIRAWAGKTAKQPVRSLDDGNAFPSNYHLSGGEEQLFVNRIIDQDLNFNSSLVFEKTKW